MTYDVVFQALTHVFLSSISTLRGLPAFPRGALRRDAAGIGLERLLGELALGFQVDLGIRGRGIYMATAAAGGASCLPCDYW